MEEYWNVTGDVTNQNGPVADETVMQQQQQEQQTTEATTEPEPVPEPALQGGPAGPTNGAQTNDADEDMEMIE